MNEKMIEPQNNEFWKLYEQVFFLIHKKGIYSILDTNSSKNTISALLHYFNNSNIDTYIKPGDSRKIDNIKMYVKSHRYSLIEKDFIATEITKKYDLIIAGNYFSEYINEKITFDYCLDKLLKLKSKYYIIFDTLDNPTIDFLKLEEKFKANSYRLRDFSDYERTSKFGFINDSNYLICLFEYVKRY